MSAWQTARALGRRASWLTWYTSRSPHHVRSTWWQARSLSVYHLRRVDTVKFHTKRLPLNSRSSTPHMNTEAMPPPSLRARGCPAPAAAAQQARLQRPQRLGSRSRLLLAAGGVKPSPKLVSHRASWPASRGMPWDWAPASQRLRLAHRSPVSTPPARWQRRASCAKLRQASPRRSRGPGSPGR